MPDNFASEAESHRETLVAADREDLRRARIFEEWLDSEGWQIYSSLLDSKVQEHGDLLTIPEQQLRAAAMPTNSEFIKGTLYGLLLARDYPSTIIRTVRAQLGNQSDAPTATERSDDDENPGEINDPVP